MTTQPLTADEFIQSIADFDSLDISLQCDLLAFYLLNHYSVPL
jgi:hypothetical protein